MKRHVEFTFDTVTKSANATNTLPILVLSFIKFFSYDILHFITSYDLIIHNIRIKKRKCQKERLFCKKIEVTYCYLYFSYIITDVSNQLSDTSVLKSPPYFSAIF